MEWNTEENFSVECNMEWKIFSMEWTKIASMEYGKIVIHSMPWLVITFFNLREILQNLPLVMSQNREMQGFQWYGVKWFKSFFRE